MRDDEISHHDFVRTYHKDQYLVVEGLPEFNS